MASSGFQRGVARGGAAGCGSVWGWLPWALCGVVAGVAAGAGVAGEVGRTGSEGCRECHVAFHDRWATSLHGASVVPVTAAWATQQWARLPTGLRAGGARWKVEMTGDLAWAVERGRGRRERHQVTQVLRGRSVHYLMTSLEGARVQVLPLAYDTRRQEWFHTAASAVRHGAAGTEALDWRDSAYTFNQSCYGCHVSHVTPAPDAPAGTGRVAWAEPGISCETCHGPGEAHVAVCREAPPGQAPPDLKILSTRQFSPAQVNDMCAPCHARAAPLTGGFRPGDGFFDHYDLLAWEDSDFAVDGRGVGETYTYTSWRDNPCARAGQLTCLHCHTSSGRNRFEGERANDACLPCHAGQVADGPGHTRHPVGGAGSRCVDCHMPVNEFARMVRHDHSFRPPAPGVTRVLGGTNACQQCHDNRDAAWADTRVREWHAENYQVPVLQRARALTAARAGDWSRLDEMVGTVRAHWQEEVFVVSMLRLLGRCDDVAKQPLVFEAMEHASPWVRSAAAQALEGQVRGGVLPRLLQAASDPSRLVRVRAAAALGPWPRELLTPEQRIAVDHAGEEFETAMRWRRGDPEAFDALGRYWLSRGNAAGAAEAWEEALGWGGNPVALRISAATARFEAAEPALAEAHLRVLLSDHPGEARVWYNWLVFLERMGRDREAAAARSRARRALSPEQRLELDRRLEHWRSSHIP